MDQKLAASNQGILVYLDSHYDFSKFAYHGTTPIIDATSRCVIEMVSKTRVECGNSWVIEENAIQDELAILLQAGVKINEAVYVDKEV
jgi:hypothetical protein